MASSKAEIKAAEKIIELLNNEDALLMRMVVPKTLHILDMGLRLLKILILFMTDDLKKKNNNGKKLLLINGLGKYKYAKLCN